MGRSLGRALFNGLLRIGFAIVAGVIGYLIVVNAFARMSDDLVESVLDNGSTPAATTSQTP